LNILTTKNKIMEIKGKAKVANKWINNEISKTEFDFENRGNVAFGSLQWSDVKKGKNGAKDEFTTVKKRFATFDASVMDVLYNSFGKQVLIEGKLVGSSYIDKEGKKKVQEQIIVDKASLVEKEIDAHSAAKGDGFQPQSLSDDDVFNLEEPF